MFKTRITEMLGIQYPILCGGMQWISRAEFVAAICNAGGIGFITAESFETPEDLRTEIKKMHDLTDKPFGVNISMVPEFGLPERSLQFCDVVGRRGRQGGGNRRAQPQTPDAHIERCRDHRHS